MLTVQLKDANGKVNEEKEIVVSDGDTLVMKYPKDMTVEQSYQTFHMLNKALIEGVKMVGLPDGISFEVIKVQGI
jgi:hypothetical protein